MKLTEDVIQLIKHFEGFSPDAYLDPVKIPTIGIGTIKYPDGRRVQLGDVCTEAEAEGWLMHELEHDMCPAIKRLVVVPLTDYQYSALAAFTYNVGSGALSHSTLLFALNGGKYDAAAEQFLRWTKAGGKELAGLVRRRQAEREMFLGGDWKKFKL